MMKFKTVDHQTVVIKVPGGLLFRTTMITTGGCCVHTTFVPCKDDEAKQFMEKAI